MTNGRTSIETNDLRTAGLAAPTTPPGLGDGAVPPSGRAAIPFEPVAEDKTASVSDGRDFGGTLTEFVVDYLQGYTPEGTTEEIFRLAGETRDLDTLRDVNTWSTYQQYRRLLEATSEVLGGPAALAAAGSHAFDAIRNPETMETLRALDSTIAAYEAVTGFTPAYVPAVEMSFEAIGTNECRIGIHMREPNQAFREHCAFQFALLATICQIFGYPTAEILDEICQCDGAPGCSARLRWTADPTTARDAQADLRARLSEARLEELQRAVAELVAGDGLEVVLTRVLAAARRAVQAPSFVLDVLPTAAFDRLVRSAGIDRDRGAEITLAWRHLPVEAANVLVSEVRSERRGYGHLIAIRAEGGSFEGRERSVLDSYARLAASALDTDAAIMDARRQATAAQALLTLSSSLAGLASSQETVDRLAQAVPSVVDCDRVVILLVEPGGAAGRVHATYGFDHATDTELRSLEIPVTSPARSSGLYRPAPGAELSSLGAALSAAGSVRICSFAIVSDQEMLGWITVTVVAHPERLDDDIGLTDRLRGLAGQAATAIRNTRLMDEIRHQALHDHLTGLPNRALIVDRVAQALTRARRHHIDIALLFVDLDGFKKVNDTLGHGAGDELLQSVAARFAATLRATDTVARLGGDEFVVLAEGLSLAAGPELVAQRLIDVLSEPFHLGGHRTPVTISASIGIAAGVRDNAEELFRDADVALYTAKDAGKSGYVIFEAQMADALRSRREIETDLQAAVGTDQFFLVYQPIFDLATMAVSGVEALLRWRHPTRGVLQPDQFIPALETSGLIVPVGRWVMIEACRQATAWKGEQRHTKMSVNVSARQFDSLTLLDEARLALTQSGLPAEFLTIEITETCLMRDTKAALAQLNALKALGVRIAIDDFGTGYSSLAYLQQFPVDSIKIDKSFISAMAGSPEADTLVRTLIQLGHALNLETVAEGIEHSTQLAQLQTENCRTGQGYLISHPLSADQIQELFTARLSQHPGTVYA
jgi:diguanylate cyclase (GGDEF)-like protein